MPFCECGCGQDSTSTFLPGHDQKLRTSLENKVGGILQLRDIIDASEAYAKGKIVEQDLLKQIRIIFS